MPPFHDIFISYGRADSKAFAIKLRDRLQATGLEVWLDLNDIPIGVDYQRRIDDSIDATHNFLFIIAPHAVNSPYCALELSQALKYNKRIIPILHVTEISRDTWQQRYPQGTEADWQEYQAQGKHSSLPNMHPMIRKINWALFEDGVNDFDSAFDNLLELLQRHQDYVHQHTLILNQALRWQQHHCQSQYLLTGNDRHQAEAWLQTDMSSQQVLYTPSDLHCEFISESTKNANNQMTEVFLVHTQEQRHLADQIRRYLMRAGITVWNPKTDLSSNISPQERLQQAVEKTDNLVVLLSETFYQSAACQQQLDYGVQLHKRVIPLQLPDQPQSLSESAGSEGRVRGLEKAYKKMLQSNPERQMPTNSPNITPIPLLDTEPSVAFDEAMTELHRYLRLEAVYHQQHKWLLVRALKWEQQQQNPSLLLRGGTLQYYASWLKVAQQRQTYFPIERQQAFINQSLSQPTDATYDVFVSYAAGDIDFARKLNDTLQIQGKSTWFEQELLVSENEYAQELHRAIEAAENFISIVPTSGLTKAMIEELSYAQQLNKRLLAVFHGLTPPTTVPLEIKTSLQVDFSQQDGDFLANFGQLYRLIESHPQLVRQHTKLLVKAMEWQQGSQDDGFLLRGQSLREAEQWLQEATDQNPAPTDLQRAYIQASRELPLRRVKLRTVGMISVGVTLLTSLLRFFSIMGHFELMAYDHLLRQRPSEPPDNRFLIVQVDSASGSWLRDQMIDNVYQPGIGTIPDAALNQALENLEAQGPRLIGLDFYRDFPTRSDPLAQQFAQTNNLIGLCKSSTADAAGVPPAAEIPWHRVGFNDFLADSQFRLRRHWLLKRPDPDTCNTPESFNLILVQRYLASEGIKTDVLNGQQQVYGQPWLHLTDTVQIPLLWGNRKGPYYHVDNDVLRGNQTLLNFRQVMVTGDSNPSKPGATARRWSRGDVNAIAPRVSLQQVLTGQVSPELIHDKIVLIGYTDLTDRNVDEWDTPFGEIPGVVLHAQMASQLISAVLNHRPLIQWLPFWGEILWIWGCALGGGLIVWLAYRPLTLGVGGLGGLIVIYGLCYGSMVWLVVWLPLAAAGLAFILTTLGVESLNYRLRHK